MADLMALFRTFGANWRLQARKDAIHGCKIPQSTMCEYISFECIQ